MDKLETQNEQTVRTDHKTNILELLFFTILCLGEFTPFDLPFSNTTFMLLFACYSLWIRDLSWKDVGLENPPSWRNAISVGIVTAFLIVPVFIWVIMPSATWLTGKTIDFSVFESIRGNLPLLLQNIVLVWIFAAFAEELIFRGYLINRFANLIGENTKGYIIALILSSVIFGAAHSYQGLTGMINSGVIGFLLGGLYLFTNRNLWAVIICHGLIDTSFILLVYYNIDVGMLN